MERSGQMSATSLSPEERKQLVDRYYQLRRNLTAPHSKTFTMPQRQQMAKDRDAVLQEYGERLPFVPVSRCPFCVTPLEYPMDAEGLDGPWWFKGDLAQYPLPHGCEHFRVLLGAIDFKGRQPQEAQQLPEILAGPGVPFVVPRLFEDVPEMKAVIYSFTMPPGYLCYAIGYFSPQPVHGALLHQPWARPAYQVRNEQGEYESWRSANDKFDFDLQPWIDQGQLLWINPGDPKLTLQSRPPCPYVGLEGVRAPQKIVRGKLEIGPLPTGQPLQPFE
jgi:hypothetical protein